MIEKKSKKNSKGKKIKNDTKTEKKKVLKKTESSLNSKKILNKPKPKKTSKLNLTKNKKEIIVKRSSGREERFNTNRLTQTVSRSGVSFPVARDVAKSITKKIKKSVQTKSTGTTKKKQQQQPSSSLATKQKLKTSLKKEPETVIVTASQIKNLVDNELKDRNQQDHSSSFSGNTTTPNEDSSMKITLNDREPVLDKVAANKNKILYDPSK